MFGVVAREKFAIDSLPLAGIGDSGYNFPDRVLKISKVCIPQGAQGVRDSFWIRDFRANKPERVNKRESDEFLPLFAQVPERKFVSVLLSDIDGLISDEKLCAIEQS